MAKTKYPPLNSVLPAGELRVRISVRQSDFWQGTAEQLIDAGLIPDGFEWPSRTQSQYFTHNGFESRVERRAMPGEARGKSWVGVNHWQLTRYCAGRKDANVYEKQEALKHALWLRSSEGNRAFTRLLAAHQDTDFQAFKRRAFGVAP